MTTSTTTPVVSARPPYPITTSAVFAITAAFTALTFPYPHLIALLERTPTMLTHHDWWRFITPVLINPEGWRQIAFNAVALLVLGTIVEREFRAQRWLTIYLASAFVGEIAGYAWKPTSAGSSTGISGLLGAVAAQLFFARAPQARAGAILILFGAATLTYFRDLHGPPILFGFALAAAMHRFSNPPKPRRSMTRIV